MWVVAGAAMVMTAAVVVKNKIADLRAENAFLAQIIKALMEHVNPSSGHFANFALTIGMTAEHVAKLSEFWNWAELQDRATLTKEMIVKEYEARMPIEIRHHLMHMLQLHRKDHTPQFLFYTDLVLGKEPPPDVRAEGANETPPP